MEMSSDSKTYVRLVVDEFEHTIKPACCISPKSNLKMNKTVKNKCALVVIKIKFQALYANFVYAKPLPNYEKGK